MVGDFLETTIGEVCSVGDGAHAKVARQKTGILYLTSKNIGSGCLKLDSVDYITEENFEQLFQRNSKAVRRPQPGDVLIGIIGTFGNAYLYKNNDYFGISSSVAILRPNQGTLNPKFLYYIVTSQTFRNTHAAYKSGSVQGYTNIPTIKSLPILLPPLDEQKAIAHILGTLDDKIELNQQMNRTLEDIARALFKSWFIDFDPVRAKMEGRQPAGMDPETAALFPAEFEDSPLGKIPKGWRVRKLQEITSKIGSGATPRGGSQVYVDKGIALIRSQNVYDYEFRWDGLVRITKETADKLKNVNVEVNDILINITGDSILRTCVVNPSVLPARVNQHVSIIRVIDKIYCRYLHFYLVNPKTKNFLLGFDTGATRKAVTKGQLESIPVPVPPDTILFHFDRTTTQMFERINSNLVESNYLTSIRDTLLPKLLSGEIRVKDAEKVVEEVI